MLFGKEMVFIVILFTMVIWIVHVFIEKHCSTLVERGFVGKSVGLGKNDYGNAGIFYSLFLAPPPPKKKNRSRYQ